jgi:hypothetical protein
MVVKAVILGLQKKVTYTLNHFISPVAQHTLIMSVVMLIIKNSLNGILNVVAMNKFHCPLYKMWLIHSRFPGHKAVIISDESSSHSYLTS